VEAEAGFLLVLMEDEHILLSCIFKSFSNGEFGIKIKGWNGWNVA
jgi:hypothetical protein